MKKNLFDTIAGQFTKKGKKLKILRILNDSLTIVSLKTGFSCNEIIKDISEKLGCVVETKTIRLRKNVYIIPFPLTSSRRFYLIAKNLVSVINGNPSKIPLQDKIVEEIFSLIKDKQSKSLQKKENILKEANTNKANIHYRW
jgi:ribosomal protein S7